MNPDLIVQLLNMITAAQVILQRNGVSSQILTRGSVWGSSADQFLASARRRTRGTDRRESCSALVRGTWTLCLQRAHLGSHRSALQRGVLAHWTASALHDATSEKQAAYSCSHFVMLYAGS